MKVGFIGLGLMGKGMAANLQKAGYQLVVADINKAAAAPFIEKGATWADSAKSVGEQCEVVFLSLPTPKDVESVCYDESGLASGIQRGSAVFDLSTNSLEMVRHLHARFAEQGVDFLDAPISGGPAGAASGKLAIWVGGPKSVYDRYDPVLKAMADAARYIGEIGAGSIAKLVHNMASAVMSQGLSEAFTMGVKAGLEPLALWEAIRLGAAGRMRAFDIFGQRFLPGKYEPANFALRLLNKDVQLALQVGREVGVPMRLCNLTGQELTEALNRGMGAWDAMSFMALQSERAGIQKIEVPIEEVRKVQERG